MMNLQEPELSSQSTSQPPWRQQKDHGIDPTAKPETFSTSNRKRRATDELDPEEERSRRHSYNVYSRLLNIETLVDELKTNQARLRMENSQLRSDLHDALSENNSLRVTLEEQQEAILERNQALQLLLQQPGLLMQQQQVGSVLALPVVESSPIPVSTLQPPTQPVPIRPVPEQRQEQQQVTTRPQPEHGRGQQQEYSALLPGAPMPLVKSSTQRLESDASSREPSSTVSPEQTSSFVASLTNSQHSSMHTLSANAEAMQQNQKALSRIQDELDEIQDVKKKVKDFQNS
jgi:hypothetical protein